MSEDKYTISKRTGRLKKKIRYKKKKKKPFKKIFLQIVLHPLFVLFLIASMAAALYFSMRDPGQATRRQPTKNAVGINNEINQKKGQ
jgi:hypothetical protein